MIRQSGMAAVAATVLFMGVSLAPTPAAADSHRVEICHKGRTIEVSRRSVPGHQRHGDTLGECPDPLAEMRKLSERLMFTCAIVSAFGADSTTGVVVMSSSV